MIRTIYKNIKPACIALPARIATRSVAGGRSMAGRIEKLNILALLTFTVLIMAYLFITNSVAMANYNKNTLQKNIENLRTEIKIINLELSEKRSIGFLKKAIQGLNLVVNDSIQYIKIDGPVAKNQ